MDYMRLDGIPSPLSRLVYGAAEPVGRTAQEACDCLDEAYDAGFRVFDTANSYGCCEENLGIWLQKSGHRNDVVLFDKGFNPNQHYGAPVDAYAPDTIHDQVALSLRRLQTDRIDFYVLHRDDPACDFKPIVEALNEEKAKGHLLRFGASNWTYDRLRAANEWAEAQGMEGFTAAGPCYSLADLARDPWGGSVTISGTANKGFRSWLAAQHMPVFPYSSLARGFMSGKYRTDDARPIEDVLPAGTLAEYDVPANIETLKRAEKVAQDHGCAVSTVALAWLLSRPLKIFPIIAPTGKAHIAEAVAALNLRLSNEELNYLKDEGPSV